MNRTGLLAALAVGIVVGAVFGIFPELDLRLARLFFDGQGGAFAFGHGAGARLLRDAAMWIVAASAAPAVIAIMLKFLLPERRMLIPGRAAVFLLATLALAPGLVTNGILKDQWPRSRPIDVAEFGGKEHFSAWWDPHGGCGQNCSFVSGEASGAYWMFAPAALAPAPVRPYAFAAAAVFGTAVGVKRMAFGGHFASDVLFAGVFTFLVIWLVHALIYRWPFTRLSDETVEAVIARAAAPVHRHVRALLRRVAGGERA